MSAAILRVSVALGVCAALINLLWWHQPIMEMANGHTSAFKVLYAMWFVIGWGVATGALTGIAISSMQRRSPGRLSASLAFVFSVVPRQPYAWCCIAASRMQNLCTTQ